MERPRVEELSSGDENRPRRRWIPWIGLVAVIAVVIVATQHRTETSGSPDTAASTSPTPHAAAAGPTHPAMADLVGLGSRLAGVRGDPADVLAYSGNLYVAETQPASVLRMDPNSGSVLAEAAAPPQVDGLALDAAHHLVWAWGEGSGGAIIQSYQLGSVRPIRRQHTNLYVFDAAAYQGRLWLTTSRGLFWTGTGPAAPQHLPSAGADVFAIAADPSRHRLVVAAQTLRAIDPKTGSIVATVPLPLGKPSLGVVDDRVWVGGFGDTDVAKLIAYDAATLVRDRTRSAVNARLGPGAIVWPGQRVVWVRDGGTEELSCVDGSNGNVDGHWPGVQGPVTSAGGSAYVVAAGEVRRLPLPPRCPG